jgi:hypothetical protein
VARPTIAVMRAATPVRAEEIRARHGGHRIPA